MDKKTDLYMKVLQTFCSDGKAVECRDEDFHVIRSAIQKVTSTLISGERKRAFVNNESYLQCIIYALQTFPDRLTKVFIFRLLFRLFRKSGFRNYASVLIQLGLTRALFQALYTESCESNPNEELMVRLHQLLCRIGRFDKRFALRARIGQCLPITLGLLRSQVALLCSYSSVSSLGATSSNTSASAIVPTYSSLPSPLTTSSSLSHSTNGLPVVAQDSITSFSCPSSSYGSQGCGPTHNPAAGTVPLIPASVNRNLGIILRTLRLYVLGVSGKINSSILGRLGAIPLLIRLLSIIAGLPSPKNYPGQLSPNMFTNKSTPIAPTTGTQNGSISCAVSNSSSAVSVSNFSCANNVPAALSAGVSAGSMDAGSTPLNKRGAENGLVIGSSVVTAVTATASAAAAVQRHRLRAMVCRPSAKSTANQCTSTNYLASSALSLLSTSPTPIACGVRNHSRLLRLALSALHCMTKCRRCAGFAINAGGVSLLVDLFLDIHRCDLLGKRLILQRCSLACLKNLTTTRTGRKLFITCGGLHAFFAVCSGYVGPDPMGQMQLPLVPLTSKPTGDVRHGSKDGKRHRKLPKVLSTSHSNGTGTTISTASSSVAQPNSIGQDTLKVNLSIEGSTGSVHVLPSDALWSTGSSASTSNTLTVHPSLSILSAPSSGYFSSVMRSDQNQRDQSNGMLAILSDACMLLRRCCPRTRLPVATAEGILRCPLPREIKTGTTVDAASKIDTTLAAEVVDPIGSPPVNDSAVTEKMSPAYSTFSDDGRSEIGVCTELITCPPNMSVWESNSDQEPRNSTLHQIRNSDNSTQIKAKIHRTPKISSRRGTTFAHRLRLPRVGASYPTNKTTGTILFTAVPPPTVGMLNLLPSPKRSSNILHSEGTRRRQRRFLVDSKTPRRPTGHWSLKNASSGSVGCERRTTTVTHSKHPFLSSALRVIGLPCEPLSGTRNSQFRIDAVGSGTRVISSDDELSYRSSRAAPNEAVTGSPDRRSLSPTYPYLDDDDDDDYDDDEEVKEAEAVAAQSADETNLKNPQVVFAEIYETHGRFFPEWSDIPSEWPSCVTQEGGTSLGVPQPTTGPSQDELNIKESHVDDTEVESSDAFSIRYLSETRNIRGLIPFKTIAYPDLIGASAAPFIEPFYEWNGLLFPACSRDASFPAPVEHALIQHAQLDAFDPQSTQCETASHGKGTNCKQGSKPRSGRSLARSRESSHSLGSGSTKRLSKSAGNLPRSHINEANPRLPYNLYGLPHTELLDDVRRLVYPEDIVNRTVFDLDEMILTGFRDSQQQMAPRSDSPRPCYPPVKGTPQPAGESSGPIETQSINVSLEPISATPPTSTGNVAGPSFLPHLNAPDGGAPRVAEPWVECSGSGDCLLTNEDELEANRFDLDKGHLVFESRFESGNLRKAIQVRQYEYDLILSPDVNTSSNLQWFYFRVSNVESGVDYRFNLINCEKPGSQFTAGMQPLLFSVRDAFDGRAYWRRVGSRLNYYRNHFIRASDGKRVTEGNTYFTVTFVLQFPHTGDVCYLAYHYPYTYTRLLTDVARWKTKANQTRGSTGDGVYFRVQTLTHTILGNAVPVITITEKPECNQNCTVPGGTSASNTVTCTDKADASNPTFDGGYRKRPYIFLTARVHSGETNSSWVMRGLLDRLVSDDPAMSTLRQAFIFKVIPMLNPDGVICGNHRCSMAGKDLNRRWINPSADLHPTIFHTKRLLQLLHVCGRQPYLFIDFHGHSRMKNIFLYGCSPLESWINPDTRNPASIVGPGLQEDRSYRHLAEVLDTVSPAFAKHSCMYVVSKCKETTARVAVWREFDVLRSYTIEASYCGTTRYLGSLSDAIESKDVPDGHQLNPVHLRAFGAQLLDAVAALPSYDAQHPCLPTQATETSSTMVQETVPCISSTTQGIDARLELGSTAIVDANDHSDSLSSSVSTISSASSSVSLSSSKGSSTSFHECTSD